MIYRTLGRTGLKVSVIGVGTWQFGGEWGRDYTQPEVDAILDKAAELGMNLIDTAECYGDHVSEKLIGDYLARHDRSRWVIATKFGHGYKGFMDRTWQLSPSEVEAQLEASLRALRVETIDIYQFHSGMNDKFQQPELWKMLEAQRRAGKIRHLGVSISSKLGPLQAEQALHYGAEIIQVLYNRLDRRAEQVFFPSTRQDNLGVLVRVPLASGFLTGKYTAAGPFPPNDVRATYDAKWVRDALAEVERIRQNELPAGVSMAQWALAWCLKNPCVGAVIPGCKNPVQVEMNAGAVKLLSA